MNTIFWAILGTLYFGGAIWAYIGIIQYTLHNVSADNPMTWWMYLQSAVVALLWPVLLLLMFL